MPFLLIETTDIFSIRINGDRMTEIGEVPDNVQGQGGRAPYLRGL